MIACVDIIELLMIAENARFFVDLYSLSSFFQNEGGCWQWHGTCCVEKLKWCAVEV